MNKVITYVKDIPSFLIELETLAPSYVYYDDTGNLHWKIQHTPIVKNANGSLALSILTDKELSFINNMTTIESLGNYDDLFTNQNNLTIYKSVYPYDIPINYIDENGQTKQFYMPEKIGEFA